jgi:hypothetical protein
MQAAQLHLQLARPAAEAGRVQQPAQQRWRVFSAAVHRRSLKPRAIVAAAKQDQAEKDATDASGDGKQTEEDKGKYPERNAWTGGWAGGEKGVQAFVKEFENEPTPSQKREIKKAAEKDPNIVKVSFQGKKVEARRVANGEGSGSDPIYIGMKKGAAKDNDAPQYIVDDQRKYPSRESLGPLSGVVGGFAGGERGVQQYVQDGEVTIADKPRKQSSPLVFAGIVAVLGTAGALFLYNVEEVGEEIVSEVERGDLLGAVTSASSQGSAALAGFDPRTKLALEAVLAVVGVGALLFYGRKAAGDLANSARDGLVSIGKLAAFWAVVLLAAKYVIQN